MNRELLEVDLNLWYGVLRVTSWMGVRVFYVVAYRVTLGLGTTLEHSSQILFTGDPVYPKKSLRVVKRGCQVFCSNFLLLN